MCFKSYLHCLFSTTKYFVFLLLGIEYILFRYTTKGPSGSEAAIYGKGKLGFCKKLVSDNHQPPPSPNHLASFFLGFSYRSMHSCIVYQSNLSCPLSCLADWWCHTNHQYSIWCVNKRNFSILTKHLCGLCVCRQKQEDKFQVILITFNRHIYFWK